MYIKHNDIEYLLQIKQADELLKIIIQDISGINIKAIINYIACGDRRFDYKICENSGLTIADIEEILEIFTERIYND